MPSIQPKHERFVHGFLPRDARLAAVLAVIADPQFVGGLVMLLEPGAKRGGRREERRLHAEAYIVRHGTIFSSAP